MKDREVLLRLRRRYKSDEAVSLIGKQLSEAEFKLGEQRSEIEELKSEVAKLKCALADRNKTIDQQKETIALVKGQNKELRQTPERKEESANSQKWRRKYEAIVQKYQSLASVMRGKGVMPESDYYKID